MDNNGFKEKVRDWLENPEEAEYTRKIDEAWRLREEFIKEFPFRKKPDLIDDLTPERIYQKGAKNTFLYGVEYKLKHLGFIRVASDRPFREAAEKADEFKKLLKLAVDDSKSLWEKVDANWDVISGFGGDKQYAKKILCIYYPDIIPIFSTKHFEHFITVLRLDKEGEAHKKFGKSYAELSLGQKFEVLNTLMHGFKSQMEEVKDWDNRRLVRFLYKAFPPPRPPKGKPIRRRSKLGVRGFLFEPGTHEEVIALFSKLHEELGFPYILSISPSYPDAKVIDEEGEVKRVEFEVFASDFNHNPSMCDFIICWENDLGENVPEDWPEIIPIKEYLKTA